MRIGKLTSKEPYWTSSNLSFRFFWSLVVIVSVIAVLVRYAFLGTPGFPLGEGGLFIRFAELIRDNGFAVPAHAAYGDHSFPFAYPPAAFYLAAAISRLTGAGLFDIFYWLPLLLNLLAVPTFCFFAAQATRDRAIVAISAVLYVQLPHSFLWQITGGGLPRALGALISLLALGLVFRSLSQRSYPLLLMVGILVGFAILSHLEWGIFAASGIAI
ncbi:MAG TPA: hypothetical protein VJR87_09230, partial [Allosphingosinicella sp.]|nr:hypothetical protein [Allosphingosinicella sp.]